MSFGCCGLKSCTNCCRDVTNYPEETKCPQEYVEALKDTYLKPSEIQYLYKRFCFIGKDSTPYPPKYLKKFQFFELIRLQRNPIVSNILNSMFGDRKFLKFVDFAKYIAIFRANSLNTKKEQIEEAKQKKLKLLFNMYDQDRNGIISEEDLIQIVHKLYSPIMPAKQILHLVSVAISEMDTSYTHQVMFDDFCTALAVFDMDECLVIKIPESKMGQI